MMESGDDMEMAADDPSVGKETGDSSSSWAQLKISPNIVGSVRYSNFRINIYEHARNSKIDINSDKKFQQCSCDIEHKKFYYVPIAILDSIAAPAAHSTTSLTGPK